MHPFRWLSLRQLLTLPYVALVLGLAVVLGLLSYRTGRDAVDELSERLLAETVGRIGRAVDQQLEASSRVLDIAFPAGEPAPDEIEPVLSELRLRFWLATSVHRELNNYAYYGDEQGRFFGLWRDSSEAAELRLRLRGEGPRTLFRFEGPRGVLHDGLPEAKVFDPRQRPWYQAAKARPGDSWSPIYIDFRTQELVATRTRQVLGHDGQMRGVVATDVSLRQLSEFVQGLQPSAHGVAFVVEPNGDLIATSRGAHLQRDGEGAAKRLNALAADDALLATTYARVKALIDEAGEGATTRSSRIDGPDGASVQVAYARLHDNAGLDWIIAVAVPRSDFLHRVTANLYQSVALALLAALSVVGVGWISLGVVSRDLRAIAVAARQIGEGHFDTPLSIDRHDEIGDLAQSFATMRHKLSTDRLTGLANREATIRRISDRIEQHRRDTDGQPFALLFLDVDGFKAVNDRYGHGAGDQVLRELANRMATAVREGDLVARWAGDEFLIVLDGVGHVELARRIADQLEARLSEPIDAARDAQVGVSIGLALYPRDGDDVPSLIQQADADMYRRKRAT
ncbi:diguanylate cyclase domain-containing protein [Ideonella sp.]|uniref:bifunctional diguanylate cyclase/phosphodiesterase n=1 Tax=Ideonella sp. TaxID=1929293 RepID=UPI0035B1A6A1